MVAVPASLFAMAIVRACDDEDEATRFHDRDVGATNARGDGHEAGRANKHVSNVARARKGDANTCDNVTKTKLRAPAKTKIAVKPRAPTDAMERSPRPPSFFSVSSSVEIFRL